MVALTQQYQTEMYKTNIITMLYIYESLTQNASDNDKIVGSRKPFYNIKEKAAIHMENRLM